MRQGAPPKKTKKHRIRPSEMRLPLDACLRTGMPLSSHLRRTGTARTPSHKSVREGADFRSRAKSSRSAHLSSRKLPNHGVRNEICRRAFRRARVDGSAPELKTKKKQKTRKLPHESKTAQTVLVEVVCNGVGTVMKQQEPQRAPARNTEGSSRRTRN